MLLTAASSITGGVSFSQARPLCRKLSSLAPKPFAPRRQTVTRMASSVTAKAEKTVLVPVAHGTEEMEAVIVIDVLRRAGAKVTVASVENGKEVVCSRGVKVVADKLIGECTSSCYDLIACPGGMPGAEHLRDSAALEELVRSQRDAGRMYAAICATPFVFLQSKGLMDDKVATAHPAFSDGLKDQSRVLDRVVVDGNLTTSRGPGTAFEFALSLVKQMYGEEKAKLVAGPMVMYQYHV